MAEIRCKSGRGEVALVDGPFCINCVHYEDGETWAGGDKWCLRIKKEISLVTGRAEPERVRCNAERMDSARGSADRCGTAGKYFQQKE